MTFVIIWTLTFQSMTLFVADQLTSLSVSLADLYLIQQLRRIVNRVHDLYDVIAIYRREHEWGLIWTAITWPPNECLVSRRRLLTRHCFRPHRTRPSVTTSNDHLTRPPEPDGASVADTSALDSRSLAWWTTEGGDGSARSSGRHSIGRRDRGAAGGWRTGPARALGDNEGKLRMERR